MWAFINTHRAWSWFLVMGAALLAGCQDQNEAAGPADTADYQIVAQRNAVTGDAGSLGASGGFVYPSDQNGPIETGARLRVLLNVEFDGGIKQLYVAEPGDSDPRQAFSLCDPDCDGATEINTWVSGLNLLAVEDPPGTGEDTPFDVELLVQSADGVYEVVDELSFWWNPDRIEITGAERVGDDLEVTWAEQGTVSRYNLYRVDGNVATPYAARGAEGLQQQLAIEGTSATVGNAADTSAALSFWVSGMGSGGEVTNSAVQTVPGLSVDEDLVDQPSISGTWTLGSLPAALLEQFTIEVIDLDTDDVVREEAFTLEIVEEGDEVLGTFGSLTILSDSWVYDLGELPLPTPDNVSVSVALKTDAPVASEVQADLAFKTLAVTVQSQTTDLVDPLVIEGTINFPESQLVGSGSFGQPTLDVRIDGGEVFPIAIVIAEEQNASGTYDWLADFGQVDLDPVSGLSTGTYNIIVEAQDAFGNESGDQPFEDRLTIIE